MSTEYREQFIEGLRQFADFLAEHPDYPPTQEHHVLEDNDETGIAELYRLAAILGATIRPAADRTRNWEASRKFAGLWVRIVYCTRQSMADYHALNSYRQNVLAEATA